MEDIICLTEKRKSIYDNLEISDCAKIIKRDLSKSGISEEDILDFLFDYYIPLKTRANELKKEMNKKWFDISEVFYDK
ncbi:MAG: hypothetical protein E7394_04650 [Ruminococcaceae bacterium]|nr:hypothetical protein [Oscillospiraceae bacterium]